MIDGALLGPGSGGFRRLLATRLLSQLSDGVFQAALAAYVVFSPEREPTPAAIASAFAVLLLPFSLIGPFSGVLLDRWRRRQVLVLGNLLRLLLCLATAALVLGSAPTWLFFGSALLVTGINRFILAGLSASLPRVVRADQLVPANALAPTLGTVAAALGGTVAVGAHLVLPAGPGADAALLAAAAGGYGSASLTARTMAPGLLGPEDAGGPRAPLRALLTATAHGLAGGVRHLRRECRPATRALGAVTASRFCYGLLLVQMLMLCRNTFAAPTDRQAGLALLGLAVGASAVGYFAAAALTPWGAARYGVAGWLLRCLVGAAVVTPALVPFYSVGPMLLAAALIGLASQSIKISTDTAVQSSVADAYRGRVFAVYDVLFNLALVAAAALAALVLPLSGRSTAVVSAATLLYVLTALGYGMPRRSRPSDEVPASAP